jgi:hypothetical protein
MTLDRRHSVQGQAAPHNGLLFSQLFFRKQPDHLLGNPIACVPHPIHPVKQQSQLSKNEFHDRQHSTPASV